jgi:hypothetical protein
VFFVVLLLNGSDVLPMLFNERCTPNDFCYIWLAALTSHPWAFIIVLC